ncbi:MAG: uroporphyrinogen decarboxylase [Candidatus Adiutrix sp.]|jgi:uroporphyrinogen-III decarboxylase|nr:uroporphyrinogen decarboxylase [Candidatus Adiutrix sp.]
MTDMKKLYDERLGRYQAAMALEPVDRIPLASGVSTYAEVYSGNNKQETIYDQEKWLQGEIKFCQDFPVTDTLRSNRIYGPLFDALGVVNYKLPGRDLNVDTQFQFVEKEYMRPEEYDEFLANPTDFIVTRAWPRFMASLADPGSLEYANALFKAGLCQAAFGAFMMRRGQTLARDCGMPQPMSGFFLAPFDALSDTLRDFKGIMRDIRRRPDKVIKACDLLADEMANLALNTADPTRSLPVFCPTHKAMFLSPKEFDAFYWPSLKKTLDILHHAGHRTRLLLEGDWGPHIRHFLELPRASVLLDIDGQGDIYRASEAVGHHQGLAGGLNDPLLILGTPDQVREKVKNLCQTVGRKAGYIVNGACNIPYDTKPENYRAVCEAVEEYGKFDPGVKPAPRQGVAGPRPAPKLISTWARQKALIKAPAPGDEALIEAPWNRFEALAYNFWWQWVV